MAAPLFLLEEVSKTYRDPGGPPTEVLAEISLTIEAGQSVAVTGPSGSGKSTLMHILGLLHPPTSGRFLLEGRDVSALAPSEADRLRNRKIGFVFQDFCLLNNLSVMDNVCLPLVYAGLDRSARQKRARSVLDELGLGHRVGYDIRLLSGGEKQRVAIARALVGGPAVILADEPTGNLDQASGGQIMSLFNGLNERGMTIVLVTHDPALARRCPVNYHLADGRLVEASLGPD